MNKFELAQDINAEALFNTNTELLKSKGHLFYKYLQANIAEVKENKRDSFHIGSAFYFYRMVIDDNKENIEYKFSILTAYINLFEALSYRDLQSIIAAYRLHILLVSEQDFFKPKMMSFTGESLEVIFSIEIDKLNKMLNKMYFLLQYCLFQYCQEDHGRIIWKGLHEKERQTFENMYKQFQYKYNISEFDNDRYFKLGYELLTALHKELCDNLQIFTHWGVL